MSVRIVVVFVIVMAATLVISGLRYVPGSVDHYSAPICGPLTDQFGHPAGNAGPCPSTPQQLPRESRWEWAPFWVPTN